MSLYTVRDIQAEARERVQEEGEQPRFILGHNDRRGKEKGLGWGRGTVGTSWCSALGAVIESGFYF